MKPEEIIGLSIFGFLVVVFFLLYIRQQRKQREQIASYCLVRGLSLLRKGDAELVALLEEMDPDSNWTPQPIILVESTPNAIYLFFYQASSKRGRSSPSYGYACLAERSVTKPEWPVTISSRVPLLDSFVGNKVEAGGEEFRHAFTVTCTDPGSALTTVSPSVEAICMEHASGPAWGLTVMLARKGVLVHSSWARSEEQWDHLTTLTRKLLAALR